MILKIVDNLEETKVGFGDYVITNKDFSNKAYYPFIATETWDKAFIVLSENTPHGVLKQLIKHCSIVPIFEMDKLSLPIVQLLGEILPDYAMEIRCLFTRDREKLNERLNEISLKCNWKELIDEHMS